MEIIIMVGKASISQLGPDSSRLSSKGDAALYVVVRPLKEFRPDPRNPRQHSARQITKIARSIETFGFNVPILVDRNGQIVAGHGRLQAAQKLGWEAVPTIMLDAGANADCQPEWLVQFAQMGAVYARLRFGVAQPRIGLLSIGEESVKGNQLVKDTMKLMQADDRWLRAPDARFIGNVEGRDLMSTEVDVAVADGFTGNVALKSLEGALIGMVKTMELLADGDQLVLDAAHRLHAELDPENAGGGMLLGVRGVCIISHGSSSPQAVHNAVQLARDVVLADTVGALTDMAARATEDAAVAIPAPGGAED